VALYDSAVWGQNDAVFTGFLLAAVITLLWKQLGMSGVFLTLALLSKPQAIALLPLFSIVLVFGRRHLLRFIAACGATSIVVLAPFFAEGNITSGLRYLNAAVGSFPRVSVNAYNFWWSFLGEAATKSDAGSLLGNLLYRDVGLLLYLLAVVAILFVFRRDIFFRKDTEVLFLVATLLASAFFLFPTQIHERYFFSVVVFGIPLVFIDRKYAAIYAATSALFMFNLVLCFPTTYLESLLDHAPSWLGVVIAAMQVCLFLLLFAVGCQRSRTRSGPIHSANHST